MLVAWVVFPLVLVAICVGLGLLLDALSGRRLAGAPRWAPSPSLPLP
jgi:hypothetical protein